MSCAGLKFINAVKLWSLLEPRAALPHPDHLEHQGEKWVRRFDGRSYLALLETMDHHGTLRRGGPDDEPPRPRRLSH
jgi:hypothetical protein